MQSKTLDGKAIRIDREVFERMKMLVGPCFRTRDPKSPDTENKLLRFLLHLGPEGGGRWKSGSAKIWARLGKVAK